MELISRLRLTESYPPEERMIIKRELIKQFVIEQRKRVIQEIDDSRDHDSCECDNCHRWRRFYKKNI